MAVENGEWIMRGPAWEDPACIHSWQKLVDWIDEVGFLPLFRNGIDGFSAEERTCPTDWWSGDAARDPWEWRQLIARSGRVAYGKFFGKKAGFISKAWFPDFANWRRDGYDFDSRWDDGLATARQKKIMDQFADTDALLSYELKERTGFGKGGEKNFEGTVTDLQMSSYLIIRDFRQKLNNKYPPAKPGVFHRRAKPWNTSARVTSRWYGLPAARACYLPPVNGLIRSFPLSVVLLSGPLQAGVGCILRFSLHFYPRYLRNTLCTRTLCSDTCISTQGIFRKSSGYFSLLSIP